MSMAEEHPTSTTVRMREGYDMNEVDELLDRAPTALVADRPLLSPHDAVPPVVTR
jgi:DivIVA domain-containing protein